MPTFRELLDALRKENNMTIQQLADAAGLEFETVRGYLVNRKTKKKGGEPQGPRLPSLKNAIALARALGKDTTVWEACTDMAPEKKPDSPENPTDLNN